MRTASKIVALIALLSLFHTAAAAETWDETMRAAASNNDQILSARKAEESSEWSYTRAWTAFLPQINGSVSFSQTTAGSDEAASKSYSYGVNATEYLFRGLQNYYGLRSAYANVELSKASLRKTESDAYYTLRLAFIDLYMAQQNISISTTILDRLRENSRLIQLRYNSGTEDKGNLLYTKASESQGEYNLSSARRDLALARLQLKRLAGVDILTAEGEAEITMEALPDAGTLTASSPSYAMAKYTLELAEIADMNTVGEFLPTISLTGSWQRNGPDWPPENESKSWGLNLSLPIFPGGSNFVDKMINGINLDKARSDFEATRKSALFTIEQDLQNTGRSIDALNVALIFLAASAERAKIADEKYLNGLMTYNDWDTIIKNYISAQNQVLSAKSSALQAIAALKNSYGGY